MAASRVSHCHTWLSQLRPAKVARRDAPISGHCKGSRRIPGTGWVMTINRRWASDSLARLRRDKISHVSDVRSDHKVDGRATYGIEHTDHHAAVVRGQERVESQHRSHV